MAPADDTTETETDETHVGKSIVPGDKASSPIVHALLRFENEGIAWPTEFSFAKVECRERLTL